MGQYTVDAPYIGDIWECEGIIVIPVNLQGIHGRGLAKQACDRRELTYRLHNCFMNSPWRSGDVPRVLCVAVKGRAPETAKVRGAAWSESVTGGNLALLESELELLEAYAQGVCTPIWVPFLGLGFGEGSPSEILPLLRKLDYLPNVNFIRAGEETFKRHAASFQPGVRVDRTMSFKVNPAHLPKGTCNFEMEDGKPCGEEYVGRSWNSKHCSRHTMPSKLLRGVEDLRKRKIPA